MAAILLCALFLITLQLPAGVTWPMVFIFLQGAWSVFWSYAPTPEANTWYNAVFHLAQWIAFNPGRSTAVGKMHGEAAAAAQNGGTPKQ